ncbi:hypothetical protein BKA80DRAFT_320968 [Phyllosticta citrichinensis]
MLPPIVLLLNLLLLLNGHVVGAIAELLNLTVHHSTSKVIDCALQPILILVFVAMELHGALLLSDELRFCSGSTAGSYSPRSGYSCEYADIQTDLVSFCLILAFLVGGYTRGFFWDATINLSEKLVDQFIHSTTLVVAVVIPFVEQLFSFTMSQLERLREHKLATISTGALLTLVFACRHFIATYAASVALFCLVFALIGIFTVSAIVLLVCAAQCFVILASSFMRARLCSHVPVTSNNRVTTKSNGRVSSFKGESCASKTSSASPTLATLSSNNNGHTGTSCTTTNQSSVSKGPTSKNAPTETQRPPVTKNPSSTSGSSKPSVLLSTSSDQPSRPSTRTSVSEEVDQYLSHIRILETALDHVSNHNVHLESEKKQLLAENSLLKFNNQNFRHEAFKAEESFQEHLKEMEHLKAANAELCLKLENERRLNLEKDEEFDDRIKAFINEFFPQFIDIASPTSSVTTSPSTRSSNTIASPTSAELSVTATPSAGSSLPFSPGSLYTASPRGNSIVSINSLVKRRKRTTPTGPGLRTPIAIKRFLGEQKYTPDKMEGPQTPATVSSGCSLPCPSETSSKPSTTISPAASVHIPARTGNEHGLSTPRALLTTSIRRRLRQSGYAQPRTPATISTCSPLPFSTATMVSSFGSVSVNSMVKPSRFRNANMPSFESPCANHHDCMEQNGAHVTPYATARAQRFSNFLDFEDSPATVSSSSTLPMPSPSANTSPSHDPFI